MGCEDGGVGEVDVVGEEVKTRGCGCKVIDKGIVTLLWV